MAAGRWRRFVGRQAELTLFDHLLEDPETATALLWVHGPGGVGKTSLLRQFAQSARDRGVPVLAVDARDVAPVESALSAALAPAMEITGRHVVCMDTYERIADLDQWVRTELLPALPAATLVVLASRDRPAPAWSTDPGWASLMRVVPLRNLTPEESRAYLDEVGVAETRMAEVLAFTHGYPLALALVGEVARERDFDPRGSPDVIGVLLEQLLLTVPGPSYRDALAACAQVRVTDEALLAALLAADSVEAEFGWLRRLPFVESGPGGLYPHDLAREVLDADLAWRNPSRRVLLHDRARRHYLQQLEGPDAQGQQSALFDLIALHPRLRGFLQEPSTGLRVSQGVPADSADAVALVARHEGPESAALASLWWAADPGSWLVVRDAAGGAEAGGSLQAVMSLGSIPPPGDPRDADPAVVAARRQLAEHHPPLRPDERVTHVRWWLAADTYQSPSPAQNLLAVHLARHYLTAPGLAVSFLPVADPDTWAEPCAYVDMHRMPAADFSVGGRDYAVFGHDWRLVPAARWIVLMSEREVSPGPPPPAAADAPAPLLVLSREEFAGAVRDLLRDLHRPHRLRGNPLLRCRLVQARLPAGEATVEARIDAARGVLHDAVAVLRGSPRDAKGYRALHRTYVAAAPSQEAAATVLGLPSSTFRRHLAHGVQAVTELLWQQELRA